MKNVWCSIWDIFDESVDELLSDKTVSVGETGLYLIEGKESTEDIETKSNESKPVTPTESSTLLPTHQEGRAVKRLARKPVRYVLQNCVKNGHSL